ncbi:MAG: hypothetical protein IT422_15150 [Pirellulaceae bacterium]|nr:hypothetical protein [Pirellulaceae bacterium]
MEISRDAGSIPAASTSQVVASQRLAISLNSLAADRQRADCPYCHIPADSDQETSSPIGYIADRWHLLPPHIRESILTLVDAASSK